MVKKIREIIMILIDIICMIMTIIKIIYSAAMIVFIMTPIIPQLAIQYIRYKSDKKIEKYYYGKTKGLYCDIYKNSKLTHNESTHNESTHNNSTNTVL